MSENSDSEKPPRGRGRSRSRRSRRGGRRRRDGAPSGAARAAERAVAAAKEANARARARARERSPSRDALPPPPPEGAPVTESVESAAARLGIERLYPEQSRVIQSVLDGRDVLMVLPTGFGKSACYQIPSMVLPRPVLVISPLLALMRDQYEHLARRQVPCIRLDGTVRGKRRTEALERVALGGPLLVMTTPETLATADACEALAKSGVALAAIDEAHCISEWGYDFRPAYLQIGERLRALGEPPVLALTATATDKVRSAIQRFLAMEDVELVASSPHRSNLAFDVLRCGGGERLRALVRLALRVRRPGIIYCSTTRDVDEVYTVLSRFGVPAHRYHGKMTTTERATQQDAFMRRGRRTVMVATNAFGLGIDKPDIRYVMHYQSPASLEQYVQEAGRAGRDGRRSNCILLFSPEDREIHEALLARSRVRPEQLYRVGRALAAWAAEDKTPSVDALAISAELGVRTTAALLALMEEATLVKWDVSAVVVTVPADEIEERARELAGQFETLRTQDSRRLDAVAAYAALEAGCRASFLRSYFGEENGEPCGLCDVCRDQSDRPDAFFEPLNRPRPEPERKRGGRGRARPRPVAVAAAPSEPNAEAGGDGRRRRRSRSRRGGRGRRRRTQAPESSPNEPVV